MKRILLLPALLIALIPALARGQTPPPPPGGVPPATAKGQPTPSPTAAPSPTPTATPLPSNGMALLKAMQQALLAAGSVHAVFQTSSTLPGKSTVSQQDIADVSLKAAAEHLSRYALRTDLVKHISAEERSEMKVVGNRGAWRVPHMSWQCELLKSVDITTAVLALETKPQSAVSVTAVQMGNVPAYRITAKATVYAWTGNAIDTVQYTVAQDTDLPLQVKASFDLLEQGKKAPTTITEKYSHVGSPLHITLPKKCRGT